MFDKNVLYSVYCSNKQYENGGISLHCTEMLFIMIDKTRKYLYSVFLLDVYDSSKLYGIESLHPH